MFGLLAEIAIMKLESQVIRESSRLGEYVLRSCTHRPSHAGKLFGSKFLLILITIYILLTVYIFVIIFVYGISFK